MKVISNSFNYKYINKIENFGVKIEDTISIFIGLSSYETRSRFFLEKNLDEKGESRFDAFFLYNFTEFSEVFSRKKNDYFFSRFGDIHTYPRGCDNKIIKDISSFLKKIRNSTDKKLHVVIDFSCMPRTHFCVIPKELGIILYEGDIVHLVYSVGKYSKSNYPTTGISHFTPFSGAMNIERNDKVHVVGLGFDIIRTEGIINVLDPRYLITFFTKPAAIEKYEDTLIKRNKTILKQSDMTFNVDFYDIESSLSQLSYVCKDFSNIANVCIYPDGPKPMILAASMIPDLLELPGIVCFHIAPNRSMHIPPSDTKALGTFFGMELVK